MKRLLQNLLLVVWACSPASALFAQVEIGPYLQQLSSDRCLVIWYTESSTSGVLRYGTQAGVLDQVARSSGGTVHAVELSGLQPETRYFYSVGDETQTYASGESYYIDTARAPGTAFRFIAFGDFGTDDEEQAQVAAQIELLQPRAAFALLLGDIVYNSGKRSKYKRVYFDVYASTIRNTPFWPSIGNHDLKDAGGAGYYEFFYTPANNPDATEDYYSFDYGNAHFVCLDSEKARENETPEAMLTWMEQDMRAATDRGQIWQVVFFHHAPYSNGTHGDEEYIRDTYVPRMEAAGADLVLAGHSHAYERTYLLSGGQILNAGQSRYERSPGAPGTLYVVSGVGGKQGELDGSHPLMAYQKGDGINGVAVIDIDGGELSGFLHTSTGTQLDAFSVIKTVGTSVRSGDAELPSNYELSHPWPNPFNPGTRVQITLKKQSRLVASLVDAAGRLVRSWPAEDYAPGHHTLRLNLAGQPAGQYYLRVQADGEELTRKLLFLK